MANDSGGNPQVDFVWGNMAPQPDTQRVTSPVKNAYGAIASAKLNAAVGNHAAITTGYGGFPRHVANKGVPSVSIPDVTGVLIAAATTTLSGANMKVGKVTQSTVGATALNDAKVKSQEPPAATLWFATGPVDLVLYKYVA